MPIDKFGRHYHDATRQKVKPKFVIPQREKHLYAIAPLYLFSTGTYVNVAVAADKVKFAKFWYGDHEYSFPFRTGTILRISYSERTPTMYVNGQKINNVTGLTLKEADKLSFTRTDSSPRYFWAELLVKYPVIEEVS